MKNKVLSFIKQYCTLDQPILLGLSGGPDSLALLYILMELQPLLNFKLGVAHIDHCWRKTSTAEAAQLKTLSEKLGLPFHLKTLDPTLFKGNLEAACRQERLNFFKLICTEYGYQGVLLAHHSGDQTETVLKKIFEGAPLSCLGGLQKETLINNLRVWRPLLEVKKNEILDWLKQNKLIAIEDSTNNDPRFMRGKFRTTIIPELSKEFGKEIGDNLNRLAQEAKELEHYLHFQYRYILDEIQLGPFGLLMDLSDKGIESPFVIKFLLRSLCLKAGIIFSNDQVEIAANLIIENSANKKIENGKAGLFIDRQRVFLVTTNFPIIKDIIKIQPGIIRFGKWVINIEKWNGDLFKVSNWRDLWQGRAEVVIPDGQYHLVSSKSVESTASLAKWWTNAKVPAFMRQVAPIVTSEEGWSHEFLTGKLKIDQGPADISKALKTSYLKLTLELV